MRRNRADYKDPATPVTRELPEVDPALRDTADPDRIVEEMVDRLRSALRGMVALDQYGRPVPWRQVVRIALGPALLQLHEHDGTADQVIVLPPDVVEVEPQPALAEVPSHVLADAGPPAPDPVARAGRARGRHYRPD